MVDTDILFPRETTWKILEQSRNAAALRVLAQGLESSVAKLRNRAVKALLHRDEPEAGRLLLTSWPKLDDADRQCLREHRWRLEGPARSLLRDGSFSEKKWAIQAVMTLDLVDAFDAVLPYSVRYHHALQPLAAQCVLEICRRWGQRSRQGNDRLSTRRVLLDRLKVLLDDYTIHQSDLILDAWLCLVHWDDAAQREIVAAPESPLFQAMISRMKASSDPAILQLLAGYFLREKTPRAIVDAAAEHPKFELAVEMARLMEGRPTRAVMGQLKKMPPLRCAREVGVQVGDLPEPIFCNLWRILAASSNDPILVLRGILHLARLDSDTANATAADMLRLGRSCDVEHIVPVLGEAMLNDDQSARELLDALDDLRRSKSRVLHAAANRFFEQFYYECLVERIKQWPTPMCQAMATITYRVDPTTITKLETQLRSPSLQRVLSALQIVKMLDLAPKLADILIELVHDYRLEVRVRVIELLSSAGYEPLREMIPELLQDANTDIQLAAERAARRFGQHVTGHGASPFILG